MSYCRFQNTLLALQDCQHAIEAMVGGGPGDPAALSRDELKAAVDLVVLCNDLALSIREGAGLDDDSELNENDVAAVLEEANRLALLAALSTDEAEADEEAGWQGMSARASEDSYDRSCVEADRLNDSIIQNERRQVEGGVS